MKSTAYFRNIVWALAAALMVACETHEDVMTQEQMRTQSNASAKITNDIVLASHDALDVTTQALSTQGVSNGRYYAGRVEHYPTMDCRPSITASFSIDRSHPDSAIYKGVLVIDYRDGSSCSDSTAVRKGKIIDSLEFIVRYKDSIVYDLTQSVTFQGFQKDSTTIDGSFTSHSTSGGVTTLTISDAKLTYADGTSYAWEGTLTSTIHREMGGQNEGDDEGDGPGGSRVITGSISGTNRDGVHFESAITEGILFDFSCFRHFPVKGTVETTVGSEASTLDYGDGTCDKKYTITTGGTTTEYEFHHHHAD